MSYDITSRFFHWMEANNITRQHAAESLGVDERSLSTYRSRGLPRKKHARAEQLMMAHLNAAIPTSSDENKVNIVFNDADFAMILDAAEIVGSQLTEFIKKAATFKAQEDLAKNRFSRVAEDPTEYKSTPKPESIDKQNEA